MGEAVDNQDRQPSGALHELYDWVESGITALLAMVLVFLFVGRVITVVGQSMYPTLEENDRLFSYSFAYTPKSGDIVIVTRDDLREPLIKRVVATQGQTVDIDFEAGVVQVDGVVLEENYINEPTYRSFDMEFPQTVPPGHVFVMGDNRNNSLDSRDLSVGMVDSRHLLGKAVFRFMPFEKVGKPQ